MTRSGFDEDCDEYDPLAAGRFQAALNSAIRGKRGQAFLRELRDALDAMPEKRLIAHELVDCEGECCAIGSVAIARKMDVSAIDPEEWHDVAKAFGIPQALVREIEFENDEFYSRHDAPERRWERMRKWVERQIIPSTDAGEATSK